jgi:hypothetical protein
MYIRCRRRHFKTNEIDAMTDLMTGRVQDDLSAHFCFGLRPVRSTIGTTKLAKLLEVYDLSAVFWFSFYPMIPL